MYFQYQDKPCTLVHGSWHLHKYKFNFDNDIKIPINLKKQQLFTIYKEDYLKEKAMGIDIKRGSLIKHYSFYYYVYGEY